MLNKAEHLGLYKNFVCGDANEKLPFGNNSFKSIFSNIIYWLKDPYSVFSELYRILMPGGTLCAILQSTNYNEFRFSTKSFPEYGDEFAKMLSVLDRGRTTSYQSVYTFSEWSDIARKSGFTVLNASTYLSPLVVRVADVGLRPILPTMIKLVNSLSDAERLERKIEFVDLFFNLEYPLVLNDQKLLHGSEGAYCCLVLKK